MHIFLAIGTFAWVLALPLAVGIHSGKKHLANLGFIAFLILWCLGYFLGRFSPQ